ncbi:MAG TPA: hypothetical protein VG890_04315 [Puia sp.]|nr:hypothetical protein [Puia sp.]
MRISNSLCFSLQRSNPKISAFLFFIVAWSISIEGFCQPGKWIGRFPLSPAPYSLSGIGLQSYPYENRVNEILRSPLPAGWEKSGATRKEYLLMMERIVRTAAGWVDSSGAVIDPYYHAEFGQTTPRFVSSAAVLLNFGYIQDLKEMVFRAMTYSCSRLAEGKADSPDFWMRELTTAFLCLKPIAGKAVWHRWEDLLQHVDPEHVYKQVSRSGQGMEHLHNWTVYSSGGEFVREALGLTKASSHFLQGRSFFDKYMPSQLGHFTSEGMYRDPNDPITYDITTRLQIANALVFGYDGSLRAPLNELLRRGGLTTLLFTAPDGLAPFGGRSGQFQFQEAIIAALCEFEATRYKTTDKKLAGAFKRQAHISALSMQRWIMEMQPLRHIKNGFPPETQSGIDEYGRYSVYALYCSSVLGLAALYADDNIEESPCPAEIGGYLIELYPAFHKIFASTGASQIEIDTDADPHYDATGLGRFQVRGMPIELGLSMPFAAHPQYLINDSVKPPEPYAIGPIWKTGAGWQSLASKTDLMHETKIVHLKRDTVGFNITYGSRTADSLVVEQDYLLTANELNIVSSVHPPKGIVDSTSFTVPLLVSDGNSKSWLTESDGDIRVEYLGHVYRILFDKELSYEIMPAVFANRNGIYRNLLIKSAGNTIEVKLKLE